MNEIDAAIDRIERQIQGLQAQLTKLKEARDLARGILTGGYVATLAEQKSLRQRKRASNRLTIADAATQILREKGEMHADDILEELRNFEMTPSKPTLVSGLLRDREKRFILVGNNRFRLNDTSTDLTTPATVPSKAERKIKMEGLTEETRKATKAFGNAEFDIFNVIDQLRIQNSSLAEMIEGDRNKQASLSGTLKRLADELHELEVVKRGKGSSPTVYKTRQAEKQSDTESESTSDNPDSLKSLLGWAS